MFILLNSSAVFATKGVECEILPTPKCRVNFPTNSLARFGGGVIDGGGGETIYPSIEEVKLAIQLTWEKASTFDLQKNLMENYHLVNLGAGVTNDNRAELLLKEPYRGKNPQEIDKEVKRIEKKLSEINSDDDLYSELVDQMMVLLDDQMNYIHKSTTLAQSKIIYEDICLDKFGVAKDATVSEYKIGADICFSLERLKKIPSASLEKEIFGLLVHEVGHLLGENEEVAHQMQERFLQGYGDIQMLMVAHDLDFMARVYLDSVSAELNPSIFNYKGGDRKLLMTLGIVWQKLDTIHAQVDPINGPLASTSFVDNASVKILMRELKKAQNLIGSQNRILIQSEENFSQVLTNLEEKVIPLLKTLGPLWNSSFKRS